MSLWYYAKDNNEKEGLSPRNNCEGRRARPAARFRHGAERGQPEMDGCQIDPRLVPEARPRGVAGCFTAAQQARATLGSRRPPGLPQLNHVVLLAAQRFVGRA